VRKISWLHGDFKLQSLKARIGSVAGDPPSTADRAFALLVRFLGGLGHEPVDQTIAFHHMHLITLRRAEAVHRSERIDFHPHRIDDQRVALPMTDRITHRRRRQIRGMGGVHANVPHIGVLIVDDADVAGLCRQHHEA